MMEAIANARRAFIVRHLGLVRDIAERMTAKMPPTIVLDDVISWGCIGLVQAVDKFDPRHGVAFGTFAAPRINGAIKDELRRIDWAPRIERTRAKKAGSESDLRGQIVESDLGTNPETGDSVGMKHLPDPRAAFSQKIEAREGVIRLLRYLNPSERQVITLFYLADWSMRETGDAMGISESRVCQVHTQAMRQLRLIGSARK